MDVELKNIQKWFGPVHANDGISLKVEAGTIQGILGENGAGKSTLMKVLSGFIDADSGEIVLGGKLARIGSPADAIRHGVGMLHQDPLDFPPMQVIDNFLIGADGSILPGRGSARREFLELAERFGFSIDPNTYVSSLTVGERQQLEILRLLWLGVNVLILDEPTTGISAPQRVKLFGTLHLLAEQSKTILFVSHKLEEVEGLCSRVAVLRRGRLVGETKAPYRTSELVEMMFGKEVNLADRTPAGEGKPVIELRGLAVEDFKLSVRGVDFQLKAGETLGLAGMEGSGQRLLLQACAGLIRPVAGQVIVGVHDLTGKHYHNFMRRGVSYMPASRLEEGLISGLTLAEHFILGQEVRRTFVDWRAGLDLAKQQIAEFSIRGTPTTRVEALSGGNQQRAMLALLKTPLKLLLMEHPTRGLDIESAIWIWGKLKERCQLGTAIIFVSSDLDELLHYSDRILVFFGGKVSHPLDASATTVEQLGELIGGVGLN